MRFKFIQSIDILSVPFILFCLKKTKHPFLFAVKGPAADATEAPQPRGLLCNPVMKMISFIFVFPCYGEPVK